MKTIRLAIISDLHYRKHEGGDGSNPCRPATATNGVMADPMSGLLRLLEEDSYSLKREDGTVADYLLCPGDISDKAAPDAFDEGWNKLKELQLALAAKHLISATGNHEVYSRPDDQFDIPGNVEKSVDPLSTLQKHLDYPSTMLTGNDRRWVYWGRGYEFIEAPDAQFLLINSSHFHPTTRALEFERGRVGDVGLKSLREEIAISVKRDEQRLRVVLLHHHPIPHQDLDVDLGKIPMDNGAKLMEVLSESRVAWLVVHGHKHHPRLVRGQGSGGTVVFAAGSFGALLTGTLATKTRPQFYLVDAAVVDQRSQPEAIGTVRAFSWTGSDWEPAVRRAHGLPDGCGYQIPQVSLSTVSCSVKAALNDVPFLRWDEVIQKVPELTHLLPEEIMYLKDALQVAGVNATWPIEKWFPTEVAKNERS
jgi:predicted MPP superfamily phosphohydrolase